MVNKVFIDTNVWLRFMLNDIPNQHKQTDELIRLFEEGRLKPYTSTIVLLEIYFVLTSYYKVPKMEAFSAINDVLETRNITLIEKTNFKKASEIFKKYNFKLSDCLIAASIPENCTFCTWDEELKKIKEVEVATPKEIVAKDTFN